MLDLFAVTDTDLYQRHCRHAERAFDDNQGPYGIDEKIAPLVRLCQSLPGLNPLWSCDGHGRMPWHLIVAFRPGDGSASAYRMLSVVRSDFPGRITARLDHLPWLLTKDPKGPRVVYPCLVFEAHRNVKSFDGHALLEAFTEGLQTAFTKEVGVHCTRSPLVQGQTAKLCIEQGGR